MIQNADSQVSRYAGRTALALLACAVLAAPAAYARSSGSLVFVPPADLPEVARETGEAAFLHDSLDGGTLLCIQPDRGNRMAVLDVTDRPISRRRARCRSLLRELNYAN